jgi:predicted KAP-like P-loop ATPase
MPYSPDRPIERDDEDRFYRSAFAGRVAYTITNLEGARSLVVGVYGKWGDGKTSALNLMRGVLAKNGDVVVIPFNPWQFSTQEQLLRAFFSTLADGLDAKLKMTGQTIGEVLKKYGGLLSLASMSFSGGAVSVNPGAAAEKLGEGLSKVELDELRTKTETILKDAGKRIVVLIDDIDRLDRREIQAIFK